MYLRNVIILDIVFIHLCAIWQIEFAKWPLDIFGFNLDHQQRYWEGLFGTKSICPYFCKQWVHLLTIIQGNDSKEYGRAVLNWAKC